MKLSKKTLYKISIILVVIYTMYVYYYYGNLKLESFVKHTVGSINILGEYIKYIFDKLISNQSISKTIIISIVLMILLKDVELSTFINSITGLEAYGVKLSKSDALKEQKNEDEKIKLMEESETQSKDKLDAAKTKKEILELLIDNDKIVNLIEKYLMTSRPIKIPLTSIPRIYKVEEIGKIFEYKTSPSAIKIISIKKDIEPILIDVFTELKEKNIIYCDI